MLFDAGRSARIKGKIRSINFNPFLAKATELFGLGESDWEAAIREYSHFLYLVYWNKRLEKTTMVVPTKLADSLWHAHILHTRAYMDMCSEIFGYYLHHNPGLKEGSTPFEVAVKHTKRLHDFVHNDRRKPGFDEDYFNFVVTIEPTRHSETKSDGGGDVIIMSQTDTSGGSESDSFKGGGGGFGGGGASADIEVSSPPSPPSSFSSSSSTSSCSSCSSCGGGGD
jgi:hypothetical protein